MNQDERYLPPEYPFGFGFALMQNPRAMQTFKQMNEGQKRDLGRRLQTISSEKEIKNLIDELAL